MTEWIPISTELPPNDDTLIYEDDGIFKPLVNYASVTLQHIHSDIRNFGYSRVKRWCFMDSYIKEPAQGPDTVSKEEIKEAVKKVVSERKKEEKKEWTSTNGKWTIQWSSDKKGNLVDNKTGKIYLWSYKDEEVKVIGTKIPKYVEKVIRENAE